MLIFNTLRYKNFLSTGNSFTTIPLDSHPTTLVLGLNGSGKSTMLDALTFALFGKPFRKINKTQLINTINNSTCLVEVDFTIGTTSYMIRRGMKPAVFEIYENGTMLNQSSATRDYQDYLERMILKMNLKSFTQVVVLGSSSFIPFMQLVAADRRSVIEEILDIQVFSVMNTLLKERVSNAKIHMIKVTGDLTLCQEQVRLTEDFVKSLEQSKQEKEAEITTEILGLETQFDKLSKNVHALWAEKEAQELSIPDEADVEKKLITWTNRRVTAQNKINEHRGHLKFFEDHTECPTCEQELAAEFVETKKVNHQEDLTKYTVALQKINDEISKLTTRQTEIRAIKFKITKLDQDVATKQAEVKLIKKQIKKLENDKINTSTTKLDDTKSSLTSLKTGLQLVEDTKAKLIQSQHYLGVVSQMLKDTGIKSSIVKQYLPVINRLVNKYLAAMDFFVSFTLDENFTEVIKSRYRDDFSYASFSEGEKMRIDLSLLFTWREIAKMKNSAATNLLILDEVVDSSLDLTGTELFLKLLTDVGKKSNVFVISHKADTMVDKFSTAIKFVKKKNFSFMEVA